MPSCSIVVRVSPRALRTHEYAVRLHTITHVYPTRDRFGSLPPAYRLRCDLKPPRVTVPSVARQTPDAFPRLPTLRLPLPRYPTFRILLLLLLVFSSGVRVNLVPDILDRLSQLNRVQFSTHPAFRIPAFNVLPGPTSSHPHIAPHQPAPRLARDCAATNPAHQQQVQMGAGPPLRCPPPTRPHHHHHPEPRPLSRGHRC